MKTESMKFKLFYFVRFFGDALFYSFMSIYFVSKGITSGELGIILAITPIATIVVNPLWNYVVKNSKVAQNVMKFMTLTEGILIITITQVTGFELYVLIVALIAMLCSPFIGIQDGFTATFANNNGIEFAGLRIWASVAYVMATTVAGVLILYLGYDFLFIIAGGFFIASTVLVWLIKPIEKTKDVTEKPKRNFRALMKNKEFFKYLIAYTVIVGAVRTGDAFFGVYITGPLGLSTLGWGICYSAFVLIEVLVLRYLTLHGNQYQEKTLFVVGVICFFMKYLSYSLGLPLPILLVTTMLRGLAWGIFIYTHIKYLVKIVRMENITMAILIVTLLYAILTGMGNLFAGWFISQYGYGYFFTLQTALIFLGLVFFLVFTPKINKIQTIE